MAITKENPTFTLTVLRKKNKFRSLACHVHILGAPGSGVTTLGKALAARLGFSHFDTDDYYWFTGDDLPYKRKRNVEHRCSLLSADLLKAECWVLSGSLCGWGDRFIPEFDAVVYLWLPAEIRLARIRERETKRYGADRLETGGDLSAVYRKFLDWAASYDDAGDKIRSRAAELRWLEQLHCPAFIIEDEMLIDQLTDVTAAHIAGL